MEMIDKMGRRASMACECAIKATGKLTRELRLRSMLSANKTKIEDLYEDIGRYVYEKYLLGEKIEIQNELLHDCTLIDIIASEVEDIRMELLKLKELKQCPKCHHEINLTDSFCPNCGAEQKSSVKNKTEVNSANITTTDGEDNILNSSTES